MKKLILCFSLLLLSLPAFSQRGIHLGLGGIPQNSWILNRQDKLVSATEFSYEVTWGWAGQLKIGYNFGPPFGIHLQGLYSVQGQEYTSVDSTGAEVFNAKELTYVKVPVFFHFSSNPAPAMFTFGVGPYLGFLQEAQLIEDDQSVVFGPNSDAEDAYKPSDIGLAFYMGADIQLVEGIMFLNCRFQGDYSLGDIENKSFSFNGNPFYPNSRTKAANFNIGFNLGLTFCVLPTGGGGNKYWIR